MTRHMRYLDDDSALVVDRIRTRICTSIIHISNVRTLTQGARQAVKFQTNGNGKIERDRKREREKIAMMITQLYSFSV